MTEDRSERGDRDEHGRMSRAIIVLRRARSLQADLRKDLATRDFANDDIKMQTYNELCQAALRCFPDDPIIGRLPIMPDRNLEYPWFRPGITDSSVPSGRTLANIERLLNRLDELFGLWIPPDREAQQQQTNDPAGQSQTINLSVFGGTVFAAQTGAGDLSQTGSVQIYISETRRILSELRNAIGELGATDEERQAFLMPVEQLDRELQKPNPLRAVVMNAWSTLQMLATVEGTWQGWDRVQNLAAQLAPQIAALLRGTGH